ncbi:hypothetical protein OG858_47365 (plasmid) [Streptomyces europaeiscabiei]|uniref:hypothetical protein n=1 Tax=Streptomyces europaeiscabiei TaxID=146819 RepID=UPI002E80658D|nr:hypothetical protein [Streptomyces europaeiscabiei]WUD38820.1 hypothetical protein OG858_47365 [Streptomyces europaeiscabiei]
MSAYDNRPPTPPTGDDSPFRQRWFVVSAVFIVAVILLGALVVITTGDSSGDEAADPAPAPSATTAASSPADGCAGLSDKDTALPTTAPKGVTWGLFRTVALPVSGTAGPAAADGDMTTCFAHTPTGALMAAAQISIRSMLAANWEDVWVKQTFGDAKDAQLAALRDELGSSPLPEPAPGELGQFAGFRFVTYGGDTAVIELLTRFSDGALRVNTASMRWHDGDWQYEVSSTAQQRVVSSEEGFIGWGGV